MERSVHVTSDFNCEWAIVATQTTATTDETFLPWGSPYHSSHCIGRSTCGDRPCCCHRLSRRYSSSCLLASWWIVFEVTNDARTPKTRAGSDLWHNVWYIIYNNKYRQIPQQTRLCGVCSGLPQLPSWTCLPVSGSSRRSLRRGNAGLRASGNCIKEQMRALLKLIYFQQFHLSVRVAMVIALVNEVNSVHQARGGEGRGASLFSTIKGKPSVVCTSSVAFPTLHNNSCGLLPYIRKLKASRIISEEAPYTM